MSSATSLPYGLNDTAVRTTLAENITSSETSVDVSEVTNPPSTPFLIAVWVDQSPLREDDMELMEVTGVSGTTLTVNRGQKGTAAQSFSSGDKVFMGVVPSDVFDRDPAGIITSQSDIIAGNGSGNPSRIAGSTTQDDVLKINSSGTPTFGPSPAGGAFSKVSKTTINSSVAEIEFTNLGGYDEFKFVMDNFSPASTAGLRARLHNGSSYQSGSSDYTNITHVVWPRSNNEAYSGEFSEDHMLLIQKNRDGIYSASNKGAHAEINLYNTSSEGFPQFRLTGNFYFKGDTFSSFYTGSVYTTAESISKVKFYCVEQNFDAENYSRNIDHGTITLYGINR